MKFLDYEYRADPSTIEQKFKSYKKYLTDNQHLFPQSAYEFANAEWHYNAQDHRCPHDSWVDSLQILEKHSSTSDGNKGIEIQLALLGAYHDGQIQIYYEDVKGYNFNLAPDSFEVKSHGDWIIDEIHLSEQGWLIHEIKFVLNGEWKIECENIKYVWLPFER